MEISLFLQGILAGLMIAAPVGPVNILCIQRTLTKGRLCGLVSGFGSATADAIYGCVAVLGVSWVIVFLASQQVLFRLVGGLIIGYFGWKLLYTPPVIQTEVIEFKTLVEDYISTLFLTLINPLSIIAFVAIFAIFGSIETDSSKLAMATLVLGVFLGSQLWWCTLVFGTSIFRDYCLEPARLQLINKIAGIALIGVGSLVLCSIALPLSPLPDRR